MSFSPGQFITAQRLNRLQTKKYWTQASSTIGAGATDVDLTGTTMSITVETDGATATFVWSTAFYASSSAPTTNANSQAMWDVNRSPTFALVDLRTANEKVVSSQNWSTTIPTAGTYGFKLKVTTPTNFTIAVYSALLVMIDEVV